MQPSTQPSVLPLSVIRQGRNPRTYFDESEHQSLCASIKQRGILQAILLRPVNDHYEIIAGERRYRAAVAVFGSNEDFLMPVRVVDMTDEEADAAALTENVERADMSPTEEAASAAKLVGDMQGNRDEAANYLGWSRSTLDKRLALMNCSQSVQTALNERKILLGHAELLASLAKEKQDILLPIIVSEKKSVSEVKLTIENAASSLESAIFDKTDCASCQHNSSLQASMFGDSITDGNCTNKGCFQVKTEAKLDEIAAGLKDEYPIIRILRVGDNYSQTKLEADGDKGVGTEQALACRSCADFGAAVSALPQATGKIYKDRCFNTVCNAKMVGARMLAEKAAEAQPKVTSEKSAKSSTPKTSDSADKTAKVETPAVTSVTEGERIKAYREKVWRKAMKTEIAADPELSVMYLIALSMNGSARHISSTGLSKAFGKLSGKDAPVADLGLAVQLVMQADKAVRAQMLTLLAASAMDALDVHHLQTLAKQHQLDLTKHWALDKELLDLLTKSEIQFLATQVGLDKAIGDNFKKMFNEKKDDLIKQLLAIKDFNYSAVIPKSIDYK